MFLTARELIGVAGLPKTEQGMRKALARYSAAAPEFSRKRSGSKATEFSVNCLPLEVRQVVLEQFREAALALPAVQELPVSLPAAPALKTDDKLALLRQCPALLEQQTAKLTEKQQSIANSRCALVVAVLRLQDTGLSRIKAIRAICAASRDGTLPAELLAHADCANARKGKRSGIGERSLNEWVVTYERTTNGAERLALLAPGHHKAVEMDRIGWWPRFAKFWRNHNGPTIRHCYRQFEAEWSVDFRGQPQMLAQLPSYYAVKRVINEKMSKRERLRGRVSGSAARALEVYSRRDWSAMPVNGCWICDGKSLDMKVKHPVSGNAIVPELTLVIDGRTRVVVGWSLSLSENVRGVSEAYRHGMKKYGKPLFVYTDNGPGQKNKTLDADITGIFPRLGIEHMTGIPGNPQARGIIERLNAVIPYAIAQRVKTYNGRGVDKENLRKLMVAIDSAENAQRQGKPLDNRQRRALAAVPEWLDVMDMIQEEVDNYNNTHEHSELPKINGRYMSPALYRDALLLSEGDDIEYLTDIELREMFMPEEIRIAARGWVQLANNLYFSNALADHDGQKVRVAYDLHDANEVIVRKMDGSFICKAVWNGNTRAAIPETKVEQALKERAQRQIERLDKKKQRVIEDITPAIDSTAEVFSYFDALDIPVVVHENDEEEEEFNFLGASYQRVIGE
ncbi:Mu transposase C-terminal domain-containing protein [Salmonella enterica subsp. enterica serovar 3,10:z10:-]